MPELNILLNGEDEEGDSIEITVQADKITIKKNYLRFSDGSRTVALVPEHRFTAAYLADDSDEIGTIRIEEVF
jgi:hypothetical protein